ncbi:MULTISPECIES: pyridoxamine 5'-phosphate oxidase family protein [Arthrobacter]|uniref:pyridoxamine 5'-phosphate oxidase family protein n=1 Tax=unclassified Arthrobacter TaxID=235627 RepID=UPI0024BAC4C7|nr:pyridoxamine 5'-phosphate oxidase family protein [Arthrobacter sp. H35-MC1]MDJ0315597.1 pyridoxamine 5'-phosphate oxidase family protein [Arthrobacter sp. H35-MC1]
MTDTPAHAHTEELPAHECWDLLRGVSVGRLGLWVEDHPDIFPINFAVDHGTLVFRTAPGTKLSAALGDTAVALEADGVDAISGVAWSVVIKGMCTLISSTEEVLDSFSIMLFPWHSGSKNAFLRITPSSITGRRFTVAAPGEWWTTQAKDPHTSAE